MQFIIPCETYAKFARLALTDESADWQIVRLEHLKGVKYAIASDHANIIVYNLGDTDQPDGAVNIIANAELIVACEKEISFNSNLTIVPIAELQIASATTTFGFSYSGNPVAFEEKTKLARWRELVPELAKKSRGAMYLNAARIAKVVASSPSGSIRFPEFIDVTQPIIVRDVIDANWFAMFLATRKGDVEVEPATIPAWINP